MTPPPCYLCGAAPARRRVGIAEVDVCPGCGLGRLADARPTEDYWQRTSDLGNELEERYWRARLAVQERALDQVERHQPPGRLVDIGGGVGHFAELALARGWDAYSVDVSEPAAAETAIRVGAERSLRSVPVEMEGTCSVVTLWCVVAHVADPRAVVGDALRLLNPQGRLLLTTPNFAFQAVYARLAARIGRPVDFAAADHTLHFTTRSLDLLLADCGARGRYRHWGITEDCLLERRLARWLVPLKRTWNTVAETAAARGLPRASSELQVEATLAPPA